MSESVFPKSIRKTSFIFKYVRRQGKRNQNGKVRIKFQKNCSGQKNEKLFDFVFVACGAIGTPHLLKKSGLGGRLVGQI